MNAEDINSMCQAETQDEFGVRRHPSFLFGPNGLLPRLRRRSVVVVSATRYLRDKGLLFTVRKSLKFGAAMVGKKLTNAEPEVWKTPAIEGAVLGLQPGDWVQVKSLDEVLQTLDSAGKTHGLFFTNEMKLHCENKYRVFKRVESIFNEFTKEQRKVKNTVLLETVLCQGEGLGCNRSCFHMWREAWLRRVDGPGVELSNAAANPLLPILNNAQRDVARRQN